MNSRRTNMPRASGSDTSKVQSASTLHHFPQIWLLVVSLCAFGLYVAFDLGLLNIAFSLDRSRITAVIAALVLMATAHAAWHVLQFSQRISVVQLQLADVLATENTRNSASQYLDNFLDDLNEARSLDTGTNQNNAGESVVEIYADRLRSAVDLGWFLVDFAVRLGLVGTIIGFILIFTSLSSTTITGTDGLRELLVLMSGGMGTALFTTLAGLVGASIMSFQYLILGREVESLVGLLIRLHNRQAGRTQ